MAQSPFANGAFAASLNGDLRAQMYVGAYWAALEAHWSHVASYVRPIGTPAEQAHVLAEWQADYFKRDYSPFPRYAAPRMPRPFGELDGELDQ